MKNNTFKKEERLCSVRLIDSLFHKGSSFVLYPYRIVYYVQETESNVPAQTIISVSKRRFKKAVDRNAIKRRMRECYRLQKSTSLYPFLEEQQIQLLLAIQFVGKAPVAYDVMFHKLEKAITRFKDDYLKIHIPANS